VINDKNVYKLLLGLINTVRTVSLTPLIVFIDTIDEKLTCITLRVITVIAGVAACSAQIFSGDVFTGTTYNLVTRSKVQEGNV
jgi:uncharacterized membrane protein